MGDECIIGSDDNREPYCAAHGASVLCADRLRRRVADVLARENRSGWPQERIERVAAAVVAATGDSVVYGSGVA